MDGGSLIEKAIEKIIVASATVSEGQLEQSFANILSEVFGVEQVNIRSEIKSDGGVFEYVANTKRPYIDNQLSQYSEFPELISYWSKGEKSCAMIPVMVGGRIVSVVELLSRNENSFTDQLISAISASAYLIGLSAVYRKEEAKSTRLASYFSSAFGAPTSQMLVAWDGTIVRANPEASSRFGIPASGRIIIDSIFNTNISGIRSSANTGKALITTAKSGRRIYAIHSSEIGSNLSYLLVRDATDEERLSDIINSMGPNYGAGVMLLDKKLNIFYCTPSIKRITGYDSTLTTSKSVLELVPERERVRFQEIISGLEKSPRAYGVIGLATDKGIIAPTRFTISTTKNGYTMLFYDASAERYVESMGAAFNEFLDGSTDIVLKADESGYVTYINPAAGSALGYERSEIIRKELRSLYTDPSTLEKNLAYVRNGNKVDNIYICLIPKGGAMDENGIERKIEATNSMRMFKTSDGTEYVIIAKELETGRKLKEQEEEIDQQSHTIERLKREGELKSQFIYNISHELKTPLTSIIGFSKLLYSGDFGKMNEDQQEQISTIISESDRLMGMIAQVLDAAKLESDKMKLELSEINLKELENSPSIKALSGSANTKGLEFKWNVHFDVPTIMADPGRLIQVFVNLIGNSIKFTEKGSIEVEVTRKGRRVECSVLDTGIGIGEDFKIRRFYDAPKKSQLKQEGSGTGLGLSITKKIIELHGGQMGYEQRQGGGSRFWFTLPIKGKQKRKNK